MPERVTVLAVLQNQWFRNPERVRRLMEGPQRREWIRRFLFAGCLTGRRLQAAFGAEACDRIVWEEASRRIGGASGAAFPADLEHLRAVISDVRPDPVMVFGRVAGAGVQAAWDGPVIAGPHPTARPPINAVAELRRMAAQLAECSALEKPALV